MLTPAATACANRQQTGMEVGAVADVLANTCLVVVNGACADPGHAFAAHLREGAVLRSIQLAM